MRIINLTQHKATADQLTLGVVDLPESDRKELQKLLTFEELDNGYISSLMERAERIADLAESAICDENNRAVNHAVNHAVMIGGAPFFMSTLEKALSRRDIRVCYAFSRRESAETVNADGTVSKTAVFKHAGFIFVQPEE